MEFETYNWFFSLLPPQKFFDFDGFRIKKIKIYVGIIFDILLNQIWKLFSGPVRQAANCSILDLFLGSNLAINLTALFQKFYRTLFIFEDT